MNQLLLVGAIVAMGLGIYVTFKVAPKPKTTFLPHPSWPVLLVLVSGVLLAIYVDAMNFRNMTYRPTLLLVYLLYLPAFAVAARITRIPILREQARARERLNQMSAPEGD